MCLVNLDVTIFSLISKRQYVYPGSNLAACPFEACGPSVIFCVSYWLVVPEYVGQPMRFEVTLRVWIGFTKYYLSQLLHKWSEVICTFSMKLKQNLFPNYGCQLFLACLTWERGGRESGETKIRYTPTLGNAQTLLQHYSSWSCYMC